MALACKEDGEKNEKTYADEDELLAISPTRKHLRDEGFKSHIKQAKRMKTRAGKVDGDV